MNIPQMKSEYRRNDDKSSMDSSVAMSCTDNDGDKEDVINGENDSEKNNSNENVIGFDTASSNSSNDSNICNKDTTTNAPKLSLEEQVNELERNVTFISHQVTLLMNALHVPACPCEICAPTYKTQMMRMKVCDSSKIPFASYSTPTDYCCYDSKRTKMLLDACCSTKENNYNNSNINYNNIQTSSPQAPLSPSPNCSSSTELNVTSAAVSQMTSLLSNVDGCDQLLSQILLQQQNCPMNSGNGLAGFVQALAITSNNDNSIDHNNNSNQTAAVNASPKVFSSTSNRNNICNNVSSACSSLSSSTTINNTTTNSCGRRSKYCSASQKKVVAEYANIHGASAAARKFNIPPAVAAYYHRKQFRQQHISGQRQSAAARGCGIDSPSVASGDDLESDWSTSLSFINNNQQTSANNKQQQLVLQCEQHVNNKLNAAHCSGSPGFLRGRGRGRPKLIGDELDAELVDYMVQVKQSDPRGHLTASQALAIARDYIMEKAPGLLQEHGGQIKLKLTWAMKLVSRISERQKEIELGLPAGTLSRTGSVTATSHLPGGNFMADMMAQNLFNQHMMKQATAASSGGRTTAVSATPQILNVRELELPKANGSVEKGEIIMAERDEGDFKTTIIKEESEGNNGEDDSIESDSDDDDDAIMDEQTIDNNDSIDDNPLQLNIQTNCHLQQQQFIPTNAF